MIKIRVGFSHILNFDFPRNIEEYVHRIGRTGRAGRSGTSVTIMTREDWKNSQDLIKILIKGRQRIPDELIKMAERYAAWKEKKELEEKTYGPRPRGGGRGGGRGGRGRSDGFW